MYPPSADEKVQIENKIILLLLIDKMDIPLSNSQIVQFCLDGGYMNYYTVQQYLAEMVDKGFLDKSMDNNTTRYTITDEGIETLEIFNKNVSPVIKNHLNKYVSENKKIAKQELQCTANHFYDHTSKEYTVKCVVYEDELLLMEINLSVVSKEQAISICNNWRANVNQLYGQVLGILAKKETREKDSKPSREAPETEAGPELNA